MNSRKLVLLTASLLALCACSQNRPTYGQSEWRAPDEREGESRRKPSAPPPEIAQDVVRSAARPFRGYRVFDGRVFEEETFFTYLAAADVICFGEVHDSPLDHFAEVRLLEGMSDRRAMRGFELAVGLQMVRISHQLLLSRYEDAPRPFSALAPKIHFAEEWGYPEPYYAPVFELAAAAKARLLSLGIARKTLDLVSQRGLGALTADQRSLLPELDLTNAEHRAVFDERMKDQPKTADFNAEYHYAAQVVWDEMMADRSSNFLLERWGARKLVIFAGVDRCHRSAIPSRMLRRNPQIAVISVRAGEAQPAPADGYDFSFLFEAGKSDLD